MKIKLGDKKIKVVFLREQDLDLLKSQRLQLIEILSLPAHEKISDDDCLSWLSYQRSMEKIYSGVKVTTYEPSSENLNGDINRKGKLYQIKYNDVLKDDTKVKFGKNIYFHSFNGVLYILNSSNTVDDPMFTYSSGDLSLAIYRAVLSTVGNFDFYHKESKELLNTVKQRGYVDAGFILSKVVA